MNAVPSTPRHVRLVWAAAVVNVVIAALVGTAALRGPRTGHGDFDTFYAGWRLVVSGMADQLYRPEGLERGLRELRSQGVRREALHPFLHPPHAAVLLSPLGVLGAHGAFRLWTALELAAAALLVWRGARIAGLPIALTGAVTAAFWPAWMSLVAGQTTFLMAAALVVSLDRAIALALLTMKPQLAVLPIAWLAGHRDWRALRLSTAILAAWFGASVVAVGFAPWAAFMRQAAEAAASDLGSLRPSAMHNLRGALLLLLGDPRSSLVTLLSASATLAAILWAGRPPVGPHAAAAVALAVPFTAHHLGVYDDVLYLAAVTFWAGGSPFGRVTFVLLPATWLLGMTTSDAGPLHVACALLFLLVLADARRRPPRDARTSPGAPS